MPTYTYKCPCGHTQDAFLKISEATPVKDCPSCGQASSVKQVSAPAFQLKGTGWYATDFKRSN